MSKPLIDIANVDEHNGLRFAMTVKERDGQAVPDMTLFVSEPIDMISTILNVNNITITGVNDTYYVIEEV